MKSLERVSELRLLRTYWQSSNARYGATIEIARFCLEVQRQTHAELIRRQTQTTKGLKP